MVARLERGAAQPRPGGSASAGIPTELLRNRADLHAAEADLASATARVGVSEALLYPSLRLGGTVSTSGGVNSWSYGPQLSIPVLNQGLLRANRDAAIAQAQQAELGWRSAVLDAVEEVQSAQSDHLSNRRAVAAYQPAWPPTSGWSHCRARHTRAARPRCSTTSTCSGPFPGPAIRRGCEAEA